MTAVKTTVSQFLPLLVGVGEIASRSSCELISHQDQCPLLLAVLPSVQRGGVPVLAAILPAVLVLPQTTTGFLEHPTNVTRGVLSSGIDPANA